MVSVARLAGWITAVLFLPLLYLAIGPPLWGEPTTALSITPDAKVQGTIHCVVIKKDEDDKEAREAMNQLEKMARLKPEILVPQLIYYSVHVKGEKEAWRILGLMHHLGVRWGSEIRLALIPLIETKDEKVLRDVTMWLHNIDVAPSFDTESKLMFYRETLLAKKESPPPGLVSYVYNVSPSRALLLFGDINSENPKFGNFPRPLMWSDHVINTVEWRQRNGFIQEGDLDKVHKELDGLSKHEGWYARRYAVEVIRYKPRFGTVEIVSRLKKDNHPLVAEPAKSIK